MEVHPTPDQQTFIQLAIETGRIHRPEDAVTQAMALWEEHERRRSEILSCVDAAEASVMCGEGIIITKPSMRQLVADVKQRGRARLAAESTAPR